jgi:pentatricopeptide repeat protein
MEGGRSKSSNNGDDEELWPKALELLQQMDEDGIKPDDYCYSSAINCCGAEGRWEEACELIEKMKQGGPKSRPNKIAYTAAISEFIVSCFTHFIGTNHYLFNFVVC